jgi:hypothetical protein
VIIRRNSEVLPEFDLEVRHRQPEPLEWAGSQGFVQGDGGIQVPDDQPNVSQIRPRAVLIGRLAILHSSFICIMASRALLAAERVMQRDAVGPGREQRFELELRRVPQRFGAWRRLGLASEIAPLHCATCGRSPWRLDCGADPVYRPECWQLDPLPLWRAMMGAAATLIPGGNLGLILVGMPLLWPYAWLAFASVCVTIYVAIRITGMTAAG